MGKVILAAIIAGSVGYALGRLSAPFSRQIPTDEENYPKLARMARDMRLACRDVDPLLNEIERSYADQSLSASDLGRIARQVERLT
jgi:hypothetical protein